MDNIELMKEGVAEFEIRTNKLWTNTQQFTISVGYTIDDGDHDFILENANITGNIDWNQICMEIYISTHH